MDDKALLFDGFEEAFVGFATQASGMELAVYDHQIMVELLCKRDGMSIEDAIEFLEFNTLSAYVGRGTPLVLRRMRLQDFNEMVDAQ
jgi:hypothetical protein